MSVQRPRAGRTQGRQAGGGPPSPPRRRGPRWWAIALLLLFLIGLITAASGVAYVRNVTRDLPDVTTINWDLSSSIFDANGKEIKKLSDQENRTFVTIDKVPEHVQNAFVAIEDHTFWTHHGIYPWGIIRAGWADVLHFLKVKGATFQGASTISQQLAKNVFVGDEVSIKRKLREAALAVEMERVFTKKEILEKYLNEVFFGNQAYGIEAAAQTYFRKSVSQLTLAEGAVLAGVIQAPSDYDPYNTKLVPGQPILSSEASITRQHEVLDAMVRYGYATPEEVEKARAEKIILSGVPASTNATYVGGWVVDYVLNLLTHENHKDRIRFGLPYIPEGQLFTGGYRVYTTMDPAVQANAEKVIRERMAHNDTVFKFTEVKPEAAAAVLEVKTGRVLALVGGRDHDRERVLNRAVDTVRQPGSSIKPIGPYLAGIQSGMSPATVVDDAPFQLNAEGKIYPENYDFNFLGLIPLRTALKYSVNTVAYKLALQVGPAKILKNLQNMGISTLVEGGPVNDTQPAAMALGGLTNGVSVLDITHAYSVLANGGLSVDPVLVTEIRDATDRVIFKAKPNVRQVVEPAHAWLVMNMLESVMGDPDGFGRQAMNGWPDPNPLKRHAGGKTGTTENNTDAWFVGTTATVATGIWTGFDRPEKNKLPHDWLGAFQPSDLWNRIMVPTMKDRPDEEFPKPKSGLVQVAVDTKSGKLPTMYSPQGQTRLEWFTTEAAPKRENPNDFDKIHQPRTVCSTDPKKLYKEGCGCTPVTKIFLIRPEKWIKDPKDAKRAPEDAGQEPPTEFCAVGTRPTPTPGQTPPGSQPDPQGTPLWPPGFILTQTPSGLQLVPDPNYTAPPETSSTPPPAPPQTQPASTGNTR